MTGDQMNKYDPYAEAETLGIQVVHYPLRTANGMWIQENNLIVIRSGMKALWDRTTMAHELGHATHGHVDSRPKHEAQADRFAANRLIDAEEARSLSEWTQDAGRICVELGVTRKLWQVWTSSHERGYPTQGVA